MAPWGMRMCCFCRKSKRTDVTGFTNFGSNRSASKALRAVGWTSVALGITALGLYVGRELRIRYKFSHRTPSDFYAHAGEELGAEFGMGI
jgi:hypothetical protein